MILITGATGIVGVRLAFDLAKSGAPLRCMKRSGSDLEFVKRIFEFYDSIKGKELFESLEWIEADLLDISSLERSLEGISQVYHTAALVSYNAKDRENLLKTNVEGSSNLLNFCVDSGVSKFCHISSVAALGSPNSDGISDEESIWNKKEVHSNYSLSKYLSELEVWRACGEGLNTVIVNPSLILGPAKAFQSSGSLMAMLKKGIAYYPTGQTGYVDVRDVSKISIELMEKEVFGRKFVLNSENLEYKSVLDMSAGIHGNQAPKYKVGSGLLKMASLFEAIKSTFTGIKPRVTSETAKSASRRRTFSSERIKSELGIDFIPVEESLNYYSAFQV